MNFLDLDFQEKGLTFHPWWQAIVHISPTTYISVIHGDSINNYEMAIVDTEGDIEGGWPIGGLSVPEVEAYLRKYTKHLRKCSKEVA